MADSVQAGRAGGGNGHGFRRAFQKVGHGGGDRLMSAGKNRVGAGVAGSFFFDQVDASPDVFQIHDGKADNHRNAGNAIF
jgi:hypothetical protein